MDSWDLVFVVAVGVPCGAFLAAIVATAIGAARMNRLEHVVPVERAVWPRVSFVVPACDEAESIEPAMRSLLAQAYPDLSVIAVDDRSSDDTGAIIDRLASEHPRLTAVHVQTLPDGWLGKLNALQKGVERSDGTWLLFADADANLRPDTLKKAICWADRTELDFLSALPTIQSAGFLGDTMINVVLGMFCLGNRPWRVSDPRSATIAATGAFMLVRRSAFDRTPGFEWLRLEVADDFGLCQMIKTHGGRCELMLGGEEITIRWYSSLREIISKMQKNFFAVTGRFSLPRIAAQALVLAWLAFFPLALALPGGSTWRAGVLAACLGAQVAMTIAGALFAGRSLVPSLFPSLGFALTAFVALRSGIVGHRLGGISWRGVVYPTRLLEGRQRVRV